MTSMLFYLALLGTVVVVALLILRPTWGILAAFIVKPIVDTTWDQHVIGPLKLTEIISALVPVLVLGRLVFDRTEYVTLKRMPLAALWIVWTIDVTLFSAGVVYGDGLNEGAQVFFRHLNGLAGFYMAQAYLSQDANRVRQFAWCLVIAGLFPMATGCFEAVTGIHWRVTYGEQNIVRIVGFYHDAIAIRYYALQTILGLLLLSAVQPRRGLLLSIAMLAYGAVAAYVLQRAYSKSGTITLALWLFLWPLLLRKYRTLACVVGCAIVVSLWYAAELMESIGFIFHKEIAAIQGQVGIERTFSGRWYTWQEMMRQWEGFSAIQQLFGSGHFAIGAHNDYLQILFHGGTIGLSLYIALLVTVLVKVARNLIVRVDTFSVAALLAIIMWMVDTIGLVPSAYSGYQWFVWGVIGLSFRMRQNELSQEADVRGAEAGPAPPPAAAETSAATGLLLPPPRQPALLNYGRSETVSRERHS